MSTTLALVALAILSGALSVVSVALLVSRRRGGSTAVHSSLERIRSMGELTVLSAYIKEVVTMKTKPVWGIGSAGKILLICPYRIEFRYDLKKTKISKNGDQITVVMPPHKAEPIPGKIVFYDERKETVAFFPIDFDLELRNQMVEEAGTQAIKQAGIMQEDLQEQVRHSVRSTLTPLLSALGNDKIDFVFEESTPIVKQLEAQGIAT